MRGSEETNPKPLLSGRGCAVWQWQTSPPCSVTYLVSGECSAGAAGRVAGRLAKMRGMGGWVGEVESFTLWQESLIY